MGFSKEWVQQHKDSCMFVIAGAALVCSFFTGPFASPLGHVDPAWVAVLLCGLPIVRHAVTGLLKRGEISAEVLVSLALFAAVSIDEVFAAGEVAFIMQLGEFLEERTVARARAGIAKLVDLSPRTARKVRDDGEEIIPAEAVRVDDVLRVLPGETVPADGVIVRGQTSVDEAVISGEPLPVDKGEGDSLKSGTVNRFGAFDMRASCAGADSTLQRMIRLVESADAEKSAIVRRTDRWATWIVCAAILSALAAWLFSGEIIRAVTVLVVFCPCSLVLATPTAIMAGIGNLAGHGVLVRDGGALERLARVTAIFFDKTGTLTRGIPEVAEVYAAGTGAADAVPSADGMQSADHAGGGANVDAAALLRWTAAAEASSEHPLGKAVTQYARAERGLTLPEAEDFTMRPGMGITAVVEGRRITAGNEKLLRQEGLTPDAAVAEAAHRRAAEGCSLIFVAVDGRVAGYIALADGMRPETPAVIADVQALGVGPVLLTGDSSGAAQTVARHAGITDARGHCTPEDKLAAVHAAQQAGGAVCMIGDGINDAPALKSARVGVAMGGVGSDIAVEAADIVLVHDDIRRIPYLLRMARATMRTIHINLTLAMSINVIATLFSMAGMLTPVPAALVHNAGSVLVILHSALLLRRKPAEEEGGKRA